MTLCPICSSGIDLRTIHGQDVGRCHQCGFAWHETEPLSGPFTVEAPNHQIRHYASLEDAIAGGRALCSSYGIFRITRGRTLVKVVMVSPEDKRFSLSLQHGPTESDPARKYRFAAPDRATADRIIDRHRDICWTRGGVA